MKRHVRLAPGCMLLLCLIPVVTLAQGQATVLVPISPVAIVPVNSQSVIAANASGQVMAVWESKQGGEYVVQSGFNGSGLWQNAVVPLPPGEEEWLSTDLHGLASHGDTFSLLLDRRGAYYIYTWSGSSWGAPVLVPSEYESSHFTVDAAGNPVFAYRHQSSVIKKFLRYAGGQWQALDFPVRLEDPWHTTEDLVVGRTGALHLIARSKNYVPTIASVPAGADPMVASSWVYQPVPSEENTAVFQYGGGDQRLALDWPRQTVWGSWEDDDKLYVTHAPIGSTTEAAWQTWEIDPGEDWKIFDHRLASSKAGADGVMYMASGPRAARRLVFRWLPPTGLGQEHDVVRPGSQTEAADFSSLSQTTMSMTIDAGGVAHVIVKGKKRGEYPENVDRIYYSRITGRAVLQNEPGVTGGGQVVDTGGGETGGQQGDWTQPGGKPDLSAIVDMRAKPVMRDGQAVYRYGYYSRVVSFDVGVHNAASQYFGDVEADIFVDGAVVHYREIDDSGHMRAMIERDGTLMIRDLPSFRYEISPEDGWAAPELDTGDGRLPNMVEMRTGLGRKTLRIVVDPENKIEEENEDNNVLEMSFEVSDGREDADKLTVRQEGGRSARFGHNDLGILGSPKLYANTAIAASGLMQRPTTARMIVGNPRGAEFFRSVPVVALLDGQEVWRHTIDFMDATPHLYNRDTQWFGYTGEARRRGPEVMGGMLDVPVDLTAAAVGNHTLTLMVDSEDIFADLARDNNTATIQFRVREPGGTLRVQVCDKQTQASIGRARVLLTGLYFGVADADGLLVIPDVPAGTYQPQDLWGSRLALEPRYAMQAATEGFTVTRGQDTTAVLALEPPVQVVVEVKDQQTGEAVAEPLSTALHYVGSGTHSPAWGESGIAGDARFGSVRFHDVAPGVSEIRVSAYAFESVTGTHDIHGDANGEYHLTVTLPRKPRGEIMGTVVDADGVAVSDVLVWLNGAPRAASTDGDGSFTLAEVEAGRNYQVIARKKGYIPDQVMSGAVPADGIKTVLLQMPKLNESMKSLSVDCVAWAQVEEWPGFSFGPIGSDSYEVSAEHGKFSATMAMLYRDIQGEDNIMVDSIVLGTVGKEFWNENITYSYSLASVISTAIGQVAGKDVARLVSLISPINDTFDFLNGDTDPSQMQDGEVCGSFTSQTGAEYSSVSLIPMPSIDFSPGMSGGQTFVRTDIMEISDGLTTKRVRRQWYSPQTAVYNLGEKMALDQLEIRFYVAVLNDRLGPGPLYASSQNVIKWRPMEDKWLRFEPSAYDALGID